MQTENNLSCDKNTIYVTVRYWVDEVNTESYDIPSRFHDQPIIFYPSEPGTNDPSNCLSYCPLDGHGSASLDLINEVDRVRLPTKEELIDAVIIAARDSVNKDIDIIVVASDCRYNDKPFRKMREKRLNEFYNARR